MSIFSVCGFVLLAAVLCSVLREYDKSASVSVACAAIAAVFIYAVSHIAPIAEFAESFDNIPGIKTVFKVLGVSFFCSLSCDLCNTAGEPGLARALELAGKCTALVLCLPLVQKLLSYISELT